MNTATYDATTRTDARADRASFSPRRAARLAGIGYVLIFALAIFANFTVLEGLIEPGNAAATVANISESIGVFKLGIAAFLIVFALDVLIAWGLHVVFRDVDRDLSLMTAWFRLVYTVFLGAGLVSLLEVVQLVGGGDSLAALGAGQIEAQVMIALESFDHMWLIGLVAFGVHLVLLGALVLRSGWVSRILAALLFAAGGAYILDTMATVLLSDYDAVAGLLLAVVAVPSMIGEGWLGLWLLLRAGRRLHA